MMRSLTLLAGCGLVAFYLSGCFGVDVDTVPVAGRVTLDGQPLPDAHISFEPIQQKADATAAAVGSYARTDADGRFELKLIRGDALGAMPGRHRVRITTSRPVDPSREDSSMTEERVPATYRDGSLEFTVPPDGTDAADFAMKSE